MDKVNLKYVSNSSSSHNNNNSINSDINNPNNVLNVVKTSPLQDFLMKFAPVLKRNSVINMEKKKRVSKSNER